MMESQSIHMEQELEYYVNKNYYLKLLSKLLSQENVNS